MCGCMHNCRINDLFVTAKTHVQTDRLATTTQRTRSTNTNNTSRNQSGAWTGKRKRQREPASTDAASSKRRFFSWSAYDREIKQVIARNKHLFFPRRSLQACDTNRRWDAEENRILEQAVQSNMLLSGRPNWEAVAKRVHGRTAQQCSGHYHYLQTRDCPTKASRWSAEEERELEQAVKSNKRPDGRLNWEAVAKRVDGRTATQCADHYYQTHVRPTKTVKWSVEEDRELEQSIESNKRPHDQPLSPSLRL